MEYELINPSDPYTFIAADKEVAALVIGILGFSFGAETKNKAEEDRVPIFMFGGFEEWYKKEFGRTPMEGVAVRKKDIGEALRSFVIGHFNDRERYNAALEAIDNPEKAEIFKAKWQDGRTSLNDIGSMAHSIGKKLLAATGRTEQ